MRLANPQTVMFLNQKATTAITVAASETKESLAQYFKIIPRGRNKFFMRKMSTLSKHLMTFSKTKIIVL